MASDPARARAAALGLVLAACSAAPHSPAPLHDPGADAAVRAIATSWRAGPATSPPPREAGGRAPWKPVAPAGELRPREATWEALDAELARLLPEPEPAELVQGDEAVAWLEQELRALLAWRAPVGVAGAAGEWWSGLDLAGVLGVFREQRGDALRTARLLDELSAAVGVSDPSVRDYLAPLLRSGFLWSDAWRPSARESAAGAGDDGILEGATYTLRGSPGRPAPWDATGQARDVVQAAVLVFADLETLEDAQLDYEASARNVGRETLDVYPIAGTYVRGRHPCGRTFGSWRSFHHQALGAFFGELAYVLVNVNHYDADGTPLSESYVSEVEFEGKRHFAWLAAREAYLPVLDGEGRTVATLVVSSSTLDVAGLWELESHRREGARERLGNLKRRAEGRGPAAGYGAR